MAFDLLEDLLAFLYATGDGKDSSSPRNGSSCPECGADLETDGEDGELRCPNCGAEIDDPTDNPE